MDSVIQPPPDVAPDEESLGLRGPWAFLRQAAPGGFRGAGIQLLCAWLGFQVLASTFWARHLQGLAGWSSLYNFSGEQLSARDVWELLENGKLVQHPFGFWTSLFALAFLAWALWAGWKIQAEAGEARATFMPWLLGLVDALLIGLLPILLVEAALAWFLGRLASTGIQGLGWFNLVGGTVLRLATVSAFLLQWWLCRANRAGSEAKGFRLGGWTSLGRHLGHSFLRLWLNGMQWTVLLAGGVIVRTGLHFLVLVLAWKWGGATPGRVWAFLGLQVLATLTGAWLMGWMLRVVGCFWRHDAAVRAEILYLRRRAAGGASEA